MSRLAPLPPAPPLAHAYWTVWLNLTFCMTVLWLLTWKAVGSPGPVPLDRTLTLSFLVPELVAAWKAPSYTLSRHVWTFPWQMRYLVGAWLGWVASWTLYGWFGLVGALLGGLVFVWLSTPHLLGRRAVL